MDRAPAHAHGIDHRHPARGDVVAIAHPAGATPADLKAQSRAAVLDQPEQLLGTRIDWLGWATEAAMHMHRNFVLAADGVSDLAQRCIGIGLHFKALRAEVDAQYRVVGHDIVGAAAVDPRRVDRQSVAGQRLQPHRHVGGSDQRIAPVLWVAAGVRRTACDDDREIARSATFACQRAIGQGGFIGQRGQFARRQFGDQRCGRARTHLLVGVDHHVITDGGGKRRCLDRAKACQHHRDAALHVGNPGTIEHPGLEPCQALEAAVDGKYGIHVPGEQQPQRRLRPHLHHQMLATLDRVDATIGAHRIDRRGIDQPHVTGKRRKRVRQQLRGLGEACKIAGPAVDRGPSLDLAQHRGLVDGFKAGALGSGQSGRAGRHPPCHSPVGRILPPVAGKSGFTLTPCVAIGCAPFLPRKLPCISSGAPRQGTVTSKEDRE